MEPINRYNSIGFFVVVCNWCFIQWLATENWFKSYDINNIYFLSYHLLSITNGQTVNRIWVLLHLPSFTCYFKIPMYLVFTYVFGFYTKTKLINSRIPVHTNATTCAGFQKFWKRTAFCLFVNVKTPSPSAAPREDWQASVLLVFKASHDKREN